MFVRSVFYRACYGPMTHTHSVCSTDDDDSTTSSSHDSRNIKAWSLSFSDFSAEADRRGLCNLSGRPDRLSSDWPFWSGVFEGQCEESWRDDFRGSDGVVGFLSFVFSYYSPQGIRSSETSRLWATERPETTFNESVIAEMCLSSSTAVFCQHRKHHQHICNLDTVCQNNSLSSAGHLPLKLHTCLILTNFPPDGLSGLIFFLNYSNTKSKSGIFWATRWTATCC